MIEMLTGTLVQHSPTFIILDVCGVGYGLHVSLTCSSTLALGAKITLPCHLAVREDAMELFGFVDLAEKEVWRALISVSGIGPRTAQRILSECTTDFLVDWIAKGNLAALTKLKGIGKKTAELMLLELRPKISKLQGQVPAHQVLASAPEEAILALVALGLKDTVARKAVESALKELGGDADLNSLIALGLRKA